MNLSNLDRIVLVMYKANRPLTIREIYELSKSIGRLSKKQIANAIFNDRYTYDDGSYFRKKTKRAYGNSYYLSGYGMDRADEILRSV